MPAEVGSAYVSIIPTTRGFQSQLNRQMTPPLVKTGTDSGKRFGGAFGLGFKALAGGALAGVGLAAFAKNVSGVEGEFSQTMNVLAAVAKVPENQIKSLSDLALKFGADTVFSANEAANAMLELAKGGLTAAQIRTGALAETLTLAAASGVDMATAATIMSNAMNTFGLSAKDTPKITAALAGGANASTASIGSLGEALQQVGPGAKTAGLSVQETVAALAAFDNAGIKGSDAGTSLKTMLSRLVPQGKRAAGAMRSLGVDFTDAEGNFLPIIDVAQQLQDALKGVSDAERTSALSKIFGSDATRAASVLADEGASGLRKYIAATNDLGAAQQVADARMKGTAGAVEQLKGSFETAQLRIGQALAPAIQGGARILTSALNGLASSVPRLVAKIQDPFGTFQTEILPRLRRFGGFLKNDLGPALVDFGKVVIPALLGAVKSIAQSIGSVISSFGGGEGSARSFGQTITSVLGPAARFIAAALKIAALNVKILTTAFKILTLNIRFLAQVGAKIVGFFVRPIIVAFGTIVNAAAQAFGWLPILGPKLKAAAANFTVFKARAFAALDGFGAKGAQLGTDFTASLAAAILGSGRKVSAAVAVGTANKVRANSTALLGADSRKTKASEGLTVVVNNPKAERASESVPTAINRATRAAGWATT